jgi:hypothetical protein
MFAGQRNQALSDRVMALGYGCLTECHLRKVGRQVPPCSPRVKCWHKSLNFGLYRSRVSHGAFGGGESWWSHRELELPRPRFYIFGSWINFIGFYPLVTIIEGTLNQGQHSSSHLARGVTRSMRKRVRESTCFDGEPVELLPCGTIRICWFPVFVDGRHRYNNIRPPETYNSHWQQYAIVFLPHDQCLPTS